MFKHVVVFTIENVSIYRVVKMFLRGIVAQIV